MTSRRQDRHGHIGRAVEALVDRPSPKEKTLLSALVGMAAARPILVAGIAFPRVTTFMVALVPLSDHAPEGALRIPWLALAVLVPVIVDMAWPPKRLRVVTRQVELAPVELRADMKQEVKSAAGMGLAGMGAFATFIILLVAGVLVIAETLLGWQAALIVAGVLRVASATLALTGWARRVRKPLDATQRSLKEDAHGAGEGTVDLLRLAAATGRFSIQGRRGAKLAQEVDIRCCPPVSTVSRDVDNMKTGACLIGTLPSAE